jgi:pSer/pThr/pTyr-binding forkhead associated (FHA) protein
MSFVIIAGERYALELGDTVLGGSGEGALQAPAIAQLPPVLMLSFPVDGQTTARALGALAVTVNGSPLGRAPQGLAHGDRLEVSGIVIAYGDARRAGRTSVVSAAGPPPATVGDASSAAPTAATGGRITRLSDRLTVPVPSTGLTLGRDPSSDVILSSAGVSRQHARIESSLLGYTLKDTSANGVWLNGMRVEGHCLLGQGDVLRLGMEEFRFEADAASFESKAATPNEISGSHAVIAPREPAPRLLAVLEVVSEGALKGTRYRIERSTVQVGRGAHNEVRIANESVSTSHASLVQRGSKWTIVDLHSRNGTFVEGEIVRDQRELPDVCEVRLGSLKLLFRAINAGETHASGTIALIGLQGVE